MSLLRDWQVEPAKRLAGILANGQNAIDLSDCGVGKTAHAAFAIAELSIPTVVVCPKISCTAWEQMLERFSAKASVVGWEQLRTGKTEFGAWSNPSPAGAEREVFFQCEVCLRRLTLEDGEAGCAHHPEKIHCVTLKKKPWKYGRFIWSDAVKLVVADECFPVGTLVKTETGKRPIETLKPGERVFTPLGLCVVRRVIQTAGQFSLLRIRHSRGEIISTAQHKILTAAGWKRAGEITKKDKILYVSTFLSELQAIFSNKTPKTKLLFSRMQSSLRCGANTSKNLSKMWTNLFSEAAGRNVLFADLCFNRAVDARTPPGAIRENAGAIANARNLSGGRSFTHDNQQSEFGPGNTSTHAREKERQAVSGRSWGQWVRLYRASKTSACRAWGGLARRIQSFWGRTRQDKIFVFEVADYVNRHSVAGSKSSGGNKRTFAYLKKSQSARRSEKGNFDGAGLASFLFSKLGRLAKFGADCGVVEASGIIDVAPAGHATEVWNLEVDDLHVYELGNGEVVSNCHRANALDSLNADLIIGAAKQNIRLLGLSATAGSSPTHFRALGFMLGLHSLDMVKPGLQNWATWAYRFGCRYQPQRGLQWLVSAESQKKLMKEIHSDILPARGVRVRVEGIPGFPECEVTAEAYDLPEPEKLNALYATLAAPLADLAERSALDAAPDLPITAQLRARQKIELLKTEILSELTDDFLTKGFSVALFVNFKATIEILAKRFKTDCVIDGSPRSVEQRALRISMFQQNIRPVIICNSQAAGQSISLHDEAGGHPRVGLVSPSFSAVTFRQVLGRLHRAGSKSKALYRIVFVAKSIETKIQRAVQAKLSNLDLLCDGDLTTAPE